ncbi:predicted protein [Postia placenta Mad-698-R]|nr:predicted protein [Postia placenta Mad-698-R]
MQAPPLVYPLSLVPLVVLGLLKYAYVKYRKAQSIHSAGHPDTSRLELRLFNRIKLKIEPVQTGYLVGFLGSPEWETRINCRTTRAARRPPLRGVVTSKVSSQPSSNVLGDSSRSSGKNTSTLHASPELPSPTLMQIMGPVLSSWYDDTGARDLEIEQDYSASSGTTSGQNRSRVGSRSPISIYQSPSLSVPAPAHTLDLRPRSWDILSGEWQGTNAKATVQPGSVLQSPPNRSPTFPATSQHAESDAWGPLSPNTRPLNVLPKLKGASSPPTSASFGSLSPLGIVSGKARYVPKAVALQRRKSGSPPVGPSPLRKSLFIETSASMPAMDISRPISDAPSGNGAWNLEDLVKDGQLDVDAVSAVLGLGLSIIEDEDDDKDDPRRVTDSEVEQSHEQLSPDRFAGMGWGRACETGVTTLQMRVPGEQLTAIMEETDELSINESARNSAASLLHGVLQFSGPSLDRLIEVSCRASVVDSEDGERDADELDRASVWADEQSWRDSMSVR